MWLLGRLDPDHKSIAEFRRIHRDAVAAAGAELVRFARSCGLIRGEWVAIDGTKFRSVASADSVAEREAIGRYLDGMERADAEQQASIDPCVVAAAVEKLRRHKEPEAGFMPVAGTNAPAYNVQTAVDAEHGLILAHAVTLDAGDNRCLLPMAEAASEALNHPATLHVIADTGYSNGEQAGRLEERGIVTYVPTARGTNSHGGGALFDRTEFRYQPEADCMVCPAGKTLKRKQVKRQAIYYQAKASDCASCPLKSRCTLSAQRRVTRHLYENALNRMNQRATREVMKLRRSTVEHPFGTLKYRIFGHPRMLLRGLAGARTEIALAVMVYNLKRMINLLGPSQLRQTLTTA
jgi:transposase